MSEFAIVPETVAGAAAPLASIADATAAATARIAACSGSAAGTPLDGAFEGMLGQLGSVLPRFGEAGSRLHEAVGGAASAYAGVDAALGQGFTLNLGCGSNTGSGS